MKGMRFQIVFALFICNLIRFNTVFGQIDKKNSAQKKIKHGGIYNTYDTTLLPCGVKRSILYKTDHFIVFLQKSRIYRNGLVSQSNIFFKDDYYKQNVDSNRLGKYKIKDDTIHAIIPTSFALRGMRMKYFDAYFQGYIKNADTILDWKMVPPYPKVNPKFNDYFTYELTPKLLYFIKNNAVIYLDSLTK